jgi:hypothetical protein
VRGDRRRTRRRRLLAAAALAVLVLAGGYAAFRAATREDPQPASVREAVARFRALPPAAREPVPEFGSGPALGVYVYDTRGFEVSHVLGTRRHAYPRRTTITVSTVGSRCVRTRWDALATRWDADVACLRGGSMDWRLASRSEEHEFAGHVDRRTYRCTPASTARLNALRAGASWTAHCAIDGTTTADRTLVIGPRTLTLDGRRVRTWLLRTRTTVSGETTGTGTTSTWILPNTGLVVRRVVANASTTDTIVGDVAYEERYALALRSTRTLR